MRSTKLSCSIACDFPPGQHYLRKYGVGRRHRQGKFLKTHHWLFCQDSSFSNWWTLKNAEKPVVVGHACPFRHSEAGMGGFLVQGHLSCSARPYLLTIPCPPPSKKGWDEILGQKFTSFYSSIFSAWTPTGHRVLSSMCSKHPSLVVTAWRDPLRMVCFSLPCRGRDWEEWTKGCSVHFFPGTLSVPVDYLHNQNMRCYCCIWSGVFVSNQFLTFCPLHFIFISPSTFSVPGLPVESKYRRESEPSLLISW